MPHSLRINENRNLERAVSFSKRKKYQKIIKSPIKMIYSEALKLFKKPVTKKAKTFWNDIMTLVVLEEVSMNIYRYGFFEEGLTKMILQYLKPGMTFFDVGAHFGYFTLLGSYLVGETGQVHSFEPTPSTFKMLERNASAKTNVFLNNLAVFSEKKVISLNDYGVQYSAFNSIYGSRLPQKVSEAKAYSIEAIPIDEYADKRGIRPNFIKIDAEGSEYEILLGMEKTISKFHPIITIEVGDCGVKGVPPSKELIKYLIERGYQPFEYSAGEIKPHKIKESYEYDNILFLAQI